jgi:hypothetical protein
MVDTAQFKKANDVGGEIALQSWNYGYFYRQHDANVSGNKFTASAQEPVQIYGHKRSGNHYLSVLIDKNFTQTGNPLKLLSGHGFLNDIDIHAKYIYIKRNFDDMARSLYRYRRRQGLRVDSFEEFLNTPYNEMFDPDMTCEVEYDLGSDEANQVDAYTGVVTYFRDINMIPKEFHDLHIAHFEEAERAFKNVLIVEYDALIHSFEDEMQRIATFLGYDTTTFENVDRRVGWFNKGEQHVYHRHSSRRRQNITGAQALYT